METGLGITQIEARLRTCRPPLSDDLLGEIASLPWSKLDETETDLALDIALRLVAESILVHPRVDLLRESMNSMNQSIVLQKNREFQDQKEKLDRNIAAAK